MNHRPLLKFMKERHSIYLRRASGESPPWTKDEILRTYKFTNIYRELDRVTVWIDQNIRKPYADNPNLWLMLCIARRINWPRTLEEIMLRKDAWPVKTYDPAQLLKALDARTKRKEKIYTGAYMITAELSRKGETKSHTTAYASIGKLWNARKEIEPRLHGTLEDAFNAIQGQGFAWGSFMTAQVIADLKYTRYLEKAKDWGSWAASGPGSRRGLNRLLNQRLWEPWKEDVWLETVQKLRDRINAEWPYEKLCAQSIQNCLCEFDKFQRVKLDEGRPRSKFRPYNEGDVI